MEIRFATGCYLGSPQADHPDIFTAFQDQLGLKIETRHAPIAVLVVDHVELPTPNDAVPFLSVSPHDPA